MSGNSLGAGKDIDESAGKGVTANTGDVPAGNSHILDKGTNKSDYRGFLETSKQKYGLESTPPVITVTGFSNSGKTTFLTQIVNLLTEKGVAVGVIKNHGHAKDGVDQEGKDSWKYFQAGANPVVLSSSAQYAIFVSTPQKPASRDELVAKIADNVDLVLVEGFHGVAQGAIEVSRKVNGKPAKLSVDKRIALVTDNEELAEEMREHNKPVFALDDYTGFTNWLCEFLQLAS